MSICGCGYRVLYTEHPIESAQIKLTESEWVKVFRVENGGLRNFHVDTNAIRLQSHCFRCGVYESRSSQAISSYIFQYGAMPCHAHLFFFFLFLPLISSFSVSRFESASFDCSYCNKDRDGDTSYFFFIYSFLCRRDDMYTLKRTRQCKRIECKFPHRFVTSCLYACTTYIVVVATGRIPHV